MRACRGDGESKLPHDLVPFMADKMQHCKKTSQVLTLPLPLPQNQPQLPRCKPKRLTNLGRTLSPLKEEKIKQLKPGGFRIMPHRLFHKHPELCKLSQLRCE